MTVHIVDNFWDNYQNNEDLILRCFRYLFKRHPDNEGESGSFNNLLIRMKELKVFERFDIMKIAIAAKEKGLISEGDLSEVCTESSLKDLGINVDKKWEQFIYKWIEKIISYEYRRNGRHSRTFINGEDAVNYGIPVQNKTSWIQDPKKAASYSEKFNAYSNDRRGRKFPPTFSGRYIAGEDEFDNQLDALSTSELKSSIIDKLTGKNDIRIFELMLLNKTEKEISEELNFSKQYIGSIIRKIRMITTQLCDIVHS